MLNAKKKERVYVIIDERNVVFFDGLLLVWNEFIGLYMLVFDIEEGDIFVFLRWGS